jgi:hypothetical protein
MARGSSHNSGPAPSATALRRDKDAADWITLPAVRTGPAPAWPFPTAPTAHETFMWEAEWKRPQAVMWERGGQQVLVATWVRALLAASSKKGTAADRTSVRQLAEELGVSDSGLLRHRWLIEGTAAEAAVKSAATARPRSDTRDRMRLVVNQ